MAANNAVLSLGFPTKSNQLLSSFSIDQLGFNRKKKIISQNFCENQTSKTC